MYIVTAAPSTFSLLIVVFFFSFYLVITHICLVALCRYGRDRKETECVIGWAELPMKRQRVKPVEWHDQQCHNVRVV